MFGMFNLTTGSVKAKALTEDVEPAFNVTSTLKLRVSRRSATIHNADRNGLIAKQ